MDRHLEEALVHGPDPLHIAEVFDIDPSTAIHYASSARRLLAPHQRWRIGFDPNPDPATLRPPGPTLGFTVRILQFA